MQGPGQHRESIDLAKKAGDTKRRDYAQAQAAALEPRLAKLTISAPAKPPAGLVVTRDGMQIEPGALGIALYIDLTAPRALERATARIVPVVHDRGVGLAITGGF